MYCLIGKGFACYIEIDAVDKPPTPPKIVPGNEAYIVLSSVDVYGIGDGVLLDSQYLQGIIASTDHD